MPQQKPKMEEKRDSQVKTFQLIPASLTIYNGNGKNYITLNYHLIC
jgi:hypothetical protein